MSAEKARPSLLSFLCSRHLTLIRAIYQCMHAYLCRGRGPRVRDGPRDSLPVLSFSEDIILCMVCLLSAFAYQLVSLSVLACLPVCLYPWVCVCLSVFISGCVSVSVCLRSLCSQSLFLLRWLSLIGTWVYWVWSWFAWVKLDTEIVNSSILKCRPPTL